MRPILAAAALAVLTLAAPAAGARGPNLRRIRAGLAELAARGQLSGTVLIAKHGRPVFEHAYGVANRRTHTPNRLATRFNLASVGKTFTGVAVAQLVQAGKLRFQDRVGKYVPELRKDVGDRVTIAELLDHTSGLGDFFGDPGYERMRPRLTSLASYLPLIAEERLQFEPGARFGYSNSGYVLLGLVVERVSGESYYSYVARHVFRPAGMTATGCFWKSRRVPNRAVGYEPSSRPDTASLPPRGTSAGGCYSTAGNMLRFANALFGHRLLSPAMTRTVTTGKVAAPGGRYGYGFGIRGPRSSPTVWHNGGSPGAGAELDVNPRLGYTVVVLANVGYPLVAPALDLVLNALRVP